MHFESPKMKEETREERISRKSGKCSLQATLGVH